MGFSYFKLLLKIIVAWIHLDCQTIFSSIVLKAVHCPRNLQVPLSRAATEPDLVACTYARLRTSPLSLLNFVSFLLAHPSSLSGSPCVTSLLLSTHCPLALSANSLRCLTLPPPATDNDVKQHGFGWGGPGELISAGTTSHPGVDVCYVSGSLPVAHWLSLSFIW